MKTTALALMRRIIGWPILIFLALFSLPLELLGIFLDPLHAIVKRIYALESHVHDWIDKVGL